MLCGLCQNIDFKPWRELTRDEKIRVLACYDDDYPDDWDEEGDEFEKGNENKESSANDYQDPEGDPMVEKLADDNINYEHSLYYIYHPDIASLQKSADDGCQLCYQIRYGALGESLSKRDIKVDGHFEGMLLQLEESQINPGYNEQNYQGGLTVHAGYGCFASMRLRKKNDDFVNHALISRELDIDMTTGSRTNFDLAAQWFCDCTNNHTDCSLEHPMESKLPSRVLDIGSFESPLVLLSVGGDRVGSYATLGYCWGKFTQHVTTKENIEARKQHIDASILPKTFIDAIFVCRRLGIRFLWIDSICIIQDDNDDWKEQSAYMADIYSKGVLNLSAASGIDSHAGLFVDRDPRTTYPCPFSCRYRDEQGLAVSASFLSCLDIGYEKYGHLDTRGWTFQEMYLPRRTLRFAASGIYWICASQNASETLPTGLLPSNHKSDFDKFIRKGPQDIGSSRKDLDASLKYELYDWWYRAVKRYSSRHLTRESDRLIALSGLATIFGRELADEYLFGLWKADITRGLAWRVCRDIDGNVEKSTPDESSSSLAPSWSWASRPGKIISYFGESEENEGLEFETSINRENRATPQQRPIFDIISVSCPTQNATPSTPVTASYLRVRGLILPARHTVDDIEDHITVFRPVAKFYYTSLGTPMYDELVDKNDKLYCFAISLTRAIYKDDNWPAIEANERKALREERGMTNDRELVADQKIMLKWGCLWPGTTWCGDEVPPLNFPKDDRRSLLVFNCLILKQVGVERMGFRRVGYVEVWGRRVKDCFEDLAPSTIEII